MVRYSKEDVLNEQERLRFISACKSDKEELMVKGLLYTGMRAGEFAHMNESWVDWQKEKIHIPAQQGDWKPKTKQGVRDIPMTFELKQVLYKFFQIKKEIGLSRVSIFRIIKGVGNRLRPFKKVYPHALRATFASMLAEKGMSAADIQYIMGWAKLETANNYVRSTAAVENFRTKVGELK